MRRCLIYLVAIMVINSATLGVLLAGTFDTRRATSFDFTEANEVTQENGDDVSSSHKELPLTVTQNVTWDIYFIGC